MANDRDQKMNPPETSELVDGNGTIVGDVSFLMDYAILGHAKCATSFLSHALEHHSQVKTFHREVCDLYDHEPGRLVEKLRDLPVGDYQRGFKCPGHFSRKSLDYFPRYFPQTKLIVGIRHPVDWLESYYNFRVRHGTPLPPPLQMKNATCPHENRGVCLQHAYFHLHLAQFGQTDLLEEDELRLLESPLHRPVRKRPAIPNPVFLYHQDQMSNPQFHIDISAFLGVSLNLTRTAPKRTVVREKVWNICDDDYADLRRHLVKMGERAALWIHRYYLKAPQVFWSPDLPAMLDDFRRDPCDLTSE